MNALRYFISLLIIAASNGCLSQFCKTLLKQSKSSIVTSQIKLTKCYLEGIVLNKINQ